MARAKEDFNLRYGDKVLFFSVRYPSFRRPFALSSETATSSASNLCGQDKGVGCNGFIQGISEGTRTRLSIAGFPDDPEVLQPPEIRDCLFKFEPKQVRSCMPICGVTQYPSCIH